MIATFKRAVLSFLGYYVPPRNDKVRGCIFGLQRGQILQVLRRSGHLPPAAHQATESALRSVLLRAYDQGKVLPQQIEEVLA